VRRSLVAIVALLVACGGGGAASPTTVGGVGEIDRAAAEYASSAMRALDGTAFDVVEASDLSGVIVDLCDGLGVGAMGVAAADTGIVADDADLLIFLEVLRTGLDQVCEDRVVVDFTSIYLDTLDRALAALGIESGYDEVAAIRAAPLVCGQLDAGHGVEGALVAIFGAMFGDSDGVPPAESLPAAGGDVGAVAGAVLASATALLCPEHMGAVETFMATQ